MTAGIPVHTPDGAATPIMGGTYYASPGQLLPVAGYPFVKRIKISVNDIHNDASESYYRGFTWSMGYDENSLRGWRGGGWAGSATDVPDPTPEEWQTFRNREDFIAVNDYRQKSFWISFDIDKAIEVGAGMRGAGVDAFWKIHIRFAVIQWPPDTRVTLGARGTFFLRGMSDLSWRTPPLPVVAAQAQALTASVSYWPFLNKLRLTPA